MRTALVGALLFDLFEKSKVVLRLPPTEARKFTLENVLMLSCRPSLPSETRTISFARAMSPALAPCESAPLDHFFCFGVIQHGQAVILALFSLCACILHCTSVSILNSQT